MKHEVFSGKTVDDAINKAMVELMISSDQLAYEVIDKGSAGILGLGSKPAVIEAWPRVQTPQGVAQEFLSNVFETMGMQVMIVSEYNEEERALSLDLQGEDMGILIGKRGQTLDSLQYLTSLVVNKNSEAYIRVKLDIENYRERREDSLENLARSCASRAKKTKRPVVLEPMNPYERRIIHSFLQNDRNVVTSSEGEEPYRHVVVSLKRGGKDKKEEPAREELTEE